VSRSTGRPIALVAMGGHAFMQHGETGSIEEHERNASQICGSLMTLVERDYNIVVTHGNGPQVGNLLLQSELTQGSVPAMPLDVLVANTEGFLGYVLQQALLNHLRRRQIQRYVVTMITQVIVERDDPAFKEPTKPIGPFLTREQAEENAKTPGFGSAVTLASAAAWSPNPNNPPLYLDLPIQDGKVRPEIVAKWAANAPLAMLDQYVPNLKTYGAIAMDVGTKDNLITTNKRLEQALTAFGVAHTFEDYDGDHTNKVFERIEMKVLPFFASHLSFETKTTTSTRR